METNPIPESQLNEQEILELLRPDFSGPIASHLVQILISEASDNLNYRLRLVEKVAAEIHLGKFSRAIQEWIVPIEQMGNEELKNTMALYLTRAIIKASDIQKTITVQNERFINEYIAPMIRSNMEFLIVLACQVMDIGIFRLRVDQLVQNEMSIEVLNDYAIPLATFVSELVEKIDRLNHQIESEVEKNQNREELESVFSTVVNAYEVVSECLKKKNQMIGLRDMTKTEQVMDQWVIPILLSSQSLLILDTLRL